MSIESDDRDYLKRQALSTMRANRDRQIRAMTNRASLWLMAHPDEHPVIAYLGAKVPGANRPQDIIGEISLALDMNLVQPNESGRRLIDNVVEPWKGKTDEPTVAMVRIAIDAAMKETRRA